MPVCSVAQLERGKQAVSPSVHEYKNKVQNSHSSSSSSFKLRVHHSHCLIKTALASEGKRGLGMARTGATQNEDNKW